MRQSETTVIQQGVYRGNNGSHAPNVQNVFTLPKDQGCAQKHEAGSYTNRGFGGIRPELRSVGGRQPLRQDEQKSCANQFVLQQQFPLSDDERKSDQRNPYE